MHPAQATHSQKTMPTRREGYGRVTDGIALLEMFWGLRICIRGQGRE